jgi:hypothetical protein
MNYTLFAIAWYVIMRGLQVLFEDQAQQKWFKTLIKVVAVIVLYSAFASVIVWYKEIPLLGFDPDS